MRDIAIKVDNLGKRYCIGQREPYSTFRDAIAVAAKASLRVFKSFNNGNRSSEYFWALKDVSFNVPQGEVVGIIGRNGAGKSTLLKILSRITTPTEGTIEYNGRIGSLLEVGTGFHPELTGYENIFLSGSILGMKKREIEDKLEEIVKFAEIGKFLDTPAKRYSSGMYVRLAFAVAAHLEPDILLVDEVLAVGDAAFQKKCLGKLKYVSNEGRTVLFVSHNMAAISSLCSNAIILKEGKIDFPLGNVDEAIQRYLTQVINISKTKLSERKDRKGAGKIRITDFAIFDKNGCPQEFLVSGQSIEFRISYKCIDSEQPRNVVAAISITSHAGPFITLLTNQVAAEPFDKIDSSGFISCIIERLPLAPGGYTLNLTINQNEIMQDWIQEAVILNVESGDFYGTGKIPPPTHAGVFFEQKWIASNGHTW